MQIIVLLDPTDRLTGMKADHLKQFRISEVKLRLDRIEPDRIETLATQLVTMLLKEAADGEL